MCQTDPIDIQPFEKSSFFNAHHLQQRVKEFQEYYTVMNDIMTVANANPNVHYRYVMTATETLPGGAVPIFVKPSDL